MLIITLTYEGSDVKRIYYLDDDGSLVMSLNVSSPKV